MALQQAEEDRAAHQAEVADRQQEEEVGSHLHHKDQKKQHECRGL